MATKARNGSRHFVITTNDNGDFLEIGPPSTSNSGGALSVQFAPSLDFVGSISVFGKIMGKAAQDAGAPFVPYPYERINVAAAASDYAISSDPITSAGLIRVRAGGFSIAFLVTASAGTCTVFVWDLAGTA